MSVWTSGRGAQAEDADADGWVLLRHDWWKLSFLPVDWTCRRRRHWTAAGQRLPVHPPPPFYHDRLYNDKHQHDLDDKVASDDDGGELELNSSLVGVANAENVLGLYEAAVGIAHVPDPQLSLFYPPRPPLLYGGELNEADIARAQAQWDSGVHALLGGVLESRDFTVVLDPLGYRADFWDADFAVPKDTGTDATDSSDMSLDSDTDPLPSTPQTDRKSYADALYDRLKGAASHPRSSSLPALGKPLNASALSFVPVHDDTTPPSPSLDLPFVSSTYEFHFPSLNAAQGARPPLQRDEHGFYTTVASPVSSSEQSSTTTRSSTPKRQAAVQGLQGMLSESIAARSRASRTREIVDRLRSTTPRRQRKGHADSALRRSSDSSYSSEQDHADVDIDGWITGLENTMEAKQKENWVQGLFQCHQPPQIRTRAKGHERSNSATSTAASSMSSPTAPAPPLAFVPFFPGPFGFAAVPVPYPGAYPLPLVTPQQMMQAQWHMPAYVVPPPVYMRR